MPEQTAPGRPALPRPLPEPPPGVAQWSWLPSWFRRPSHLELPTGHHLRLLRTADADLVGAAVRGSVDGLRTRYGPARRWPVDLSPATVHAALVAQEARTARGEGFRYGFFDDEEQELLGCAHLDPTPKLGADVDVSWWVVDRFVGSSAEESLVGALVAWVEREWPFTRPRFVGRDLSWERWEELPARR